MNDGNALNEANPSLQTDDTRTLLDTVDKLRSQGISQYVDLPEIIVCGEQSCGKSSVLEAISGVRFPSKDNLCTRFATELILRRGPVAPIHISIVPGSKEERSESEKETLRKFNVSIDANDLQLGDIIESAKNAMGISDSSKVFSSDILRMEVSGPEQPHLTLVDLPGLFQAGSRSQSDEDSETVKSIVLSYMESPRSIIIAVVSARNDFNNQSITKYARKIDPHGQRTLGLITKPDTLYEGSDSERFYLELAQNKEVHFRLGWHVLRNRDYTTRNSSLKERNRDEADFFSSGIWKSLLPTQLGVHSLKPRLSKILKDQILAQLPHVLTQIQRGIEDATSRLSTLGTSRTTVQEQRRYLLNVGHSFGSLIKAATDGPYSDPFFGDASTNQGYQRRLRAVIQNQLTEFAEKMGKEGHTFDIIDEGPVQKPREILRSVYIAKVKELLKRSRGRELPGTFDPLIVGHLFHKQREPWGTLVNQSMEGLVRSVYYAVREALAYVSDVFTLEGLLRRFIYPGLDKLTSELREKVKELLRPHDTGHPITYNHYLTENVQKAQEKRRTAEIKKSLQGFFGQTMSGGAHVNVDINRLTDILATKTESDMNNYASSTATDFMEAYYKVALKNIVDDISVLAFEQCLIQKLPMLFSPEDVLDLDDFEVAALASESEESSAERARCSEKLGVLEEGMTVLRNIQGHSLAFKETPNFHSQMPENTDLENHFDMGPSTHESDSGDTQTDAADESERPDLNSALEQAPIESFEEAYTSPSEEEPPQHEVFEWS